MLTLCLPFNQFRLSSAVSAGTCRLLGAEIMYGLVPMGKLMANPSQPL
jgi:hypothetical protein